MSSPTARSLIVDLLSTLRRGSMPVAALVQAGALFDLAEGSVRVALSRLLADGRVERDERGHYRLGGAAVPVQAWVAAWRDLDRRSIAWDGGWLGALAPAAAPRRGAGRQTARALRMLGFRPLTPGLQLRPANLRGGVDGARQALVALGGPAEALVFEVSGLDAGADAKARALWDGAALVRGYRAARRRLERSGERLPRLPEAQAMTESFRLGGRVLQQLVLDPLLPAPLVDEDERRALVETMRDYDRLGRAAWAGFLGRFGVPHRAAPTDTRWAAPDRLAQSA